MIVIYLLLGAIMGALGYIVAKLNRSTATQNFTHTRKSLQSDIDEEKVEKALIKFILTEAADEHIRLAKKNDDVYICFANSEVAVFSKKWYGVLKSYKSGDIDKNMYKACVKDYLEV